MPYNRMDLFDMSELENETLPYLITQVHANAKAKGWWDEPRQPLEILMLVVTELGEAAQELRKVSTLGLDTIYFNPENPTKPEGFPIEIADAVIRLLDLCGGFQIDLIQAIEIKNRFNLTRDYKHGKRF